MAAVWKYYSYQKSDVYPRVDYFQRMLRGLLPRFKTVIGYFDEFYQDSKRVAAIDKMVNMVLQPPNILVASSRGEFDVARTAAAKSIFKPDICQQVDLDKFGSDDLSMTVVIYYHQAKSGDFLEKGFLDGLTNSVKEIEDRIHSPEGLDSHEHMLVLNVDRRPVSKLFIACDISEDGGKTDGKPETLTDETVDKMQVEKEREKMKEELEKLYPDVELIEQRLLMGEEVDLGVSISMYLESQVFLGFDNIDNYLREFRKHNPACYNVASSLGKDGRISELFKSLLGDIWLLSLSLKDLCHIQNSQGKRELSNENDFFVIFIVLITQTLKGITIQILYEKFSLSYTLTHQCLEKVDFQEKVKLSLESNSQFKSLIIRSVFSVVTECLESLNKNLMSKSKTLKLANVTEMADSMEDELISVFSALEEEVKSVEKSVDIVKKMSFEISGYYKRTKTRTERSTPKVPFTKELAMELFRQSDVMGCGFVYGLFEVLIKEKHEDEAIQDTIDEIMKHYRHIRPYTVKMVQNPKIDFMAVKSG